MSTVTILCRTPGFRRLGIAHAATATYPADRWTPEELATFEADPNFTVVVDRRGAAPIPSALPAGGFAGDSSFLLGLTGVFDTFLQELDSRLERLFSRFDDAQADFATNFGPSAVGNRGLEIAEAFVSDPTSSVAAVVQPSAVAPGADLSDAIQDNGAGPAINDLGAKPAGVAEAAALGTAESVRPPLFDDARIQAIRSTLQRLGPDFEPVSRADRKVLRQELGFDPTPEEIAEARLEAVAPEATVTT